MAILKYISRPQTIETLLLENKWVESVQQLREHYSKSIDNYNKELSLVYDERIQEIKGHIENDLKKDAFELIRLLKLRVDRLEEARQEFYKLRIDKHNYKNDTSIRI